ncbi:hypothetical protein OH491_03930 [Termitidicoccus mucosus]|uniref:Uncharacterized protein n=1 Tax=Termitidicoccus mucosus TaxID=1184151 RepID=A0A178IP24_9BACT|nr:hypothetical protein AW736_05665 [Opitutaceae bacterium TSB47]
MFILFSFRASAAQDAGWVLNPSDLEMFILSAKDEQGGHNIHPTADGGCIVAACVSNPGRGRDLGVYKFTAGLKPDLAFGDNGLWTAGSTGVDQAIDAIEVIGPNGQPDGYLVAGYVSAGDGDFANCGYHPSSPDAKQGTTGDIVLVRLTRDGKLDASFGHSGMRCYGGSDNDTIIYHPSNYSEPGNKLLQTTNGFLLAGITRSRDGDLQDIKTVGYTRSYDTWIFKVDARGEFARDFADKGSLRVGTKPGEHIGKRPANEYPWSIKADPAGGFIASGYHFGACFPYGQKDGALIPSPGNAALTTAAENASGDVNDASMDGWLFRANDKGRLRDDWAGHGLIFIGGTRQEKMYDHIVTPDGGYVVSGRTSSSDLAFTRPGGKVENFGAFLVKYDKTGALVPAFGNNGHGICFLDYCGDQVSRVANYDEGDIIGVVAGTNAAASQLSLPVGYGMQFVVVRLDAQGRPLRYWSLGREGDDWACGMDVDSRGRILLTGFNDKGRPTGEKAPATGEKKGVHPHRDLVVMRFTPHLKN